MNKLYVIKQAPASSW